MYICCRQSLLRQRNIGMSFGIVKQVKKRVKGEKIAIKFSK